MLVKDLLLVVNGQQQIIIYEKTNNKTNIYDGRAYNVDCYDEVRNRTISQVYAVDVLSGSLKIPTILVEVK